MTVSEAPRATQGSGPESAAGTAIVEQPTSATARRGHPRPEEPVRALAMVLGLTAGLSLILALFVGIAINSGPNGVRLAVAGPAPAVQQITAALTQAGGPDAFDVTVVGDEAAARAALAERTADGAIVIGPNGPTVFTASAGSPAIAQALTAVARELSGAPSAGPTVVDVVPVPEGDAHGVGLAAGSLPMIIAGLVLGAAAALSLRSRWTVLVTVGGGAVAIGLSFAGVLAWLGVSGGNYLAEASAITLAVATSGLVVAGLARLMGSVGVGVGALLLVIVGNPLSGIATSPRLLPGPWGEFGQWLPTGAGGTLLRTAAYFPDASVAFPVWVLLGWAVLGAGAVLIGQHHGTSAQGTPAVSAGRHEVAAA